MEKLKPCPFCGGKNIRIWKTSAPFVSCDDCLANTGSALTKKEAVEYWNRRANDSDKIISELQKKQEEQMELYRQTGRDEHILAMSAYAYSEAIVKGGVV